MEVDVEVVELEAGKVVLEEEGEELSRTMELQVEVELDREELEVVLDQHSLDMEHLEALKVLLIVLFY